MDIPKLKLKLKLKTTTTDTSIPSIPSIPSISSVPSIPSDNISRKIGFRNLENDPESIIWTEKYRPTTISDIIGNEKEIFIIKDWIEKFKKKDPNIKRALLLTGPSGTSKTTIAKAILNDFGYKIFYNNASDMRNKTLVENHLEQIIHTNNSKKYGIIMDEVDGMSGGQTGGIEQLIKIININEKTTKKTTKKQLKTQDPIKIKWISPIICISNDTHTEDKQNEKMKNLQKVCLEIKFTPQKSNEIKKLILLISEKEKLLIDNDSIDIIIDYCDGDFRKCINLLQSYSSINRNIKSTDLEEYINVIGDSNKELNNSHIIKKIFNTESITKIIDIFQQKKNMLPMLVHENYPKYINEYSCSYKNKLKYCYEAVNSIANSDICEKKIFTDQAWILQQYQCISSCVIPSYYCNIQKTRIMPVGSSKTLCNDSMFRGNMKNINEIGRLINTNKNYLTNDIQTLSDIILFNILYPNNNIKYGFDIMNYYNISLENIEGLIKMNKLDDEYRIYTANLKKKIQTEYNKYFDTPCIKDIYESIYNGKKKKDDDE